MLHKELVAFSLEGHGKNSVDIRTSNGAAVAWLNSLSDMKGIVSIEEISSSIVRLNFGAVVEDAIAELAAEDEMYALDYDNMVQNLNLSYWLGRETYNHVANFQVMLQAMGFESSVITFSPSEASEAKPEGFYIIFDLRGDAMAEMLIGIALETSGAKFGRITHPELSGNEHVAVFTPEYLQIPVDSSLLQQQLKPPNI